MVISRDIKKIIKLNYNRAYRGNNAYILISLSGNPTEKKTLKIKFIILKIYFKYLKFGKKELTFENIKNSLLLLLSISPDAFGELTLFILLSEISPDAFGEL